MTKHRYSKVAISDDESPAGLRKEFPEELVDAYVKLVNSEFSEKEYAKYSKLAEKFLGEKYKDKIEQGKLTVRLTKATFDLVDKYNEKKAKKKTRKSKKSKKLGSSQCTLSQVGADEGQEERIEQETMQGDNQQ